MNDLGTTKNNPHNPKELAKTLFGADEFWNFLGGENTYPELLDVFERTGITLRPEIDTRFSAFPH